MCFKLEISIFVGFWGWEDSKVIFFRGFRFFRYIWLFFVIFELYVRVNFVGFFLLLVVGLVLGLFCGFCNNRVCDVNIVLFGG